MKKLLRILCVVLSLSLLNLPTLAVDIDELYEQRDELTQKISQLKQQEKQIQQNINQTRDEKEKAMLERDQLYAEISVRTELITSLEERITLYALEISQLSDEIDILEANIDDTYDVLKQRLRVNYMTNDGTAMGIMLGSGDFAQFLTRSEYIVRVADHDREIMANLSSQRDGLREAIRNLEEVQLQQEADKAEVESEKAILDTQHTQAANKVQDINRQEQEYLADLAKNKSIQDQAQAQLDDVFRAIEWSKNAYAGGQMAWPLPGYSQLSSVFGYRFGGNDYHTGMDITGGSCYGKNIVAANDGIVKVANWSYSPGVGYGIYLIVDHGVDENGNSIATLYGHCSNLYVAEGDTVSRGETIAAVGSTGWSTGPHLHFEVRINGSAVNPASYVYNA
jgi:murein DD-endopeptidase MepM/ murein hydrolase activator NlpD